MPDSICFSAYSTAELKDKFYRDPGFHPEIGIIFSSISLGIPKLTSVLSTLETPLFGCSTGGEILPGSESTPSLEQSAVCCFMNPDPSLFSIMLFDKGNESESDFGRRIGTWGRNVFRTPAFLIAISGLENNGEAIIRGIEEVCPPNTPIFGGIAGDDGEFKETFVFTHQGYSTNGASVIVFDGSRVSVENIAHSGWVGIGLEMNVTSSEGNRVYSINNQPATKVFRDYLNVSDETLVKIGLTFPLLLKRPDGSEVLRSFLSVDPEIGALVFAGTVPQGSRVRFSSSFGYETIQNTIQEIHDFHVIHPRASLVMLFSCMARHQVAGSMIDDEIRAASELWDAPMIGFFSYGEIGLNKNATCDFYNETLCLILIDFSCA